jgi:hypothetical protein
MEYILALSFNSRYVKECLSTNSRRERSSSSAPPGIELNEFEEHSWHSDIHTPRLLCNPKAESDSQ